MILKRLSNERETVLELYNDCGELMSETKHVHFKEINQNINASINSSKVSNISCTSKIR